MRAELELITAKEQEIEFKRVVMPQLAGPYHFHPQLELTLIIEGCGRRLMGDEIAPFRNGDLVFMGPNLPHFYRSDPLAPARKGFIALVVQFHLDFLGKGSLRQPALTALGPLIRRSVRGIRFLGPVRDRVAGRLHELEKKEGLPRLACLLYILDELAHAKNYQLLASPGFVPLLNHEHARRLNLVFEFVLKNFAQRIAQADAARKASLSPAAFSRFFRKSTWRTFEAFVNEIRIGNACRMLIEEEKSITDVCYACGFNNVSNFNRRFRDLKGMSPREFRKAFQVNN